MLTGLHILLTYRCTSECDHCFLYCSPRTLGTFSYAEVVKVLQEAEKLDLEWIYFEGGEPFLFYALLLASVQETTRRGFKAGIVTNSYFALTQDDALLWLRPFAEAGLADLSISNDIYHFDYQPSHTVLNAFNAAEELGIPAGEIRIQAPEPHFGASAGKASRREGGGNLRFRGRAADQLTAGHPHLPWQSFNSCPFEELEDPERVHVDVFGNVQICQGISIGNMWDVPLSQLMKSYCAADHPICGPLVKGGPAALARALGIAPRGNYVECCHLCFTLRRSVLEKYPHVLVPHQVYGNL